MFGRRLGGMISVSDSNASHTALVARLAEEDDSLLENPSPLVETMMVERLYQYSWPTRYLPYLVLFAGFFVFRQQIDWMEVVGITLAYTLGTWWLDHQRFGFNEDSDRQQNVAYWGRRFAIGSAITGGAWGAFFWLHGTTEDYAQQAMLCLMWNGLAFSNMNTRSPHLPSHYAFFITMSVPLFIRALFYGGTPQYMMAILGVALGTALCLRAHSANRSERLAIALRLRNAELVAEIDRARAEASAAHVATEQMLAARSASYNTAERLAGFGSWEWRLEDDHLSWSDNMFRLINLTPTGAPAAMAVLLDSVHHQDRGRVDAFFADLRRTGRTGHLDFRVGDDRGEHGPSSWRPVRLLGMARRDSTGRIVALNGALRDMRVEAAAAANPPEKP